MGQCGSLHSCDTMRGIHFYGCRLVQVRRFFCLFWRETHTKAFCARSLTRPEVDAGRKVPERQSAEGSSRDKSTEQVSQEMRVGQRGDQSTEVRKPAGRTCWPTDAGSTNTRCLRVPSGFVEVSRKYTPAIACKCTENYTKVL